MTLNLARIEIVDAHHHFWELGRFPYLWLAPEAPPRRFGDHTAIKRDYLPADLRSDFEGLRLTGSVHVQANCGASDPTEETIWLQSLNEETGLPSAIVAEADLSDAAAPALIKRHAVHSSVRGVRALVAWDTAGRWRFADRPGLLLESTFRRNAGHLAQSGLSLDLVVVPDQLPEVGSLATALPDLRIAVNHFGQLEPDQPGNETVWRAGLEAIAPHGNVFLKISGLWTIDRNWQPDRLRPFILEAIEVLGSSRLMYGSNLPVEKVNTPARPQIETLADILQALPKADLENIFARTAREFYRI